MDSPDRDGAQEPSAAHLPAMKWTVSLVALLVLGVRVVFPALHLDAVSLGLLALAILPWLSPLIKSAELPGGLKIEFRDVQEAAQRIIAGVGASATARVVGEGHGASAPLSADEGISGANEAASAQPGPASAIPGGGSAPTARAPAPVPQEEFTYLQIVDQDPNLALVGLRIEIEKRLRTVAQRVGVGDRTLPLSELTRLLGRNGVIGEQAVSGLLELIRLGNQAAHGRSVSPDVAWSAADYAPDVLRALDRVILTLPVP